MQRGPYGCAVIFSFIPIRGLREINLPVNSDFRTFSRGSSESWRRALLVFWHKVNIITENAQNFPKVLEREAVYKKRKHVCRQRNRLWQSKVKAHNVLSDRRWIIHFFMVSSKLHDSMEKKKGGIRSVFFFVENWIRCQVTTIILINIQNKKDITSNEFSFLTISARGWKS